LSTQYRVDQVTVNLRTVDIRGGQILQSVSTTKTIYSYELHPSVFKFVNMKDLAEFEAGVTGNEPTQLCVNEAIEAAVVHLIAQGIRSGNWALKDEAEMANPMLRRYLAADRPQRAPLHTPQRTSDAAGGDDADRRVSAVAAGSAP
jgi:curli production assembly/transport component CsgG